LAAAPSAQTLRSHPRRPYLFFFGLRGISIPPGPIREGEGVRAMGASI
jgi:hypothetical protein